jgi:hypothetical protein
MRTTIASGCRELRRKTRKRAMGAPWFPPRSTPRLDKAGSGERDLAPTANEPLAQQSDDTGWHLTWDN